MSRATKILILVLLSALTAAADVIVLKSGRRISATNVTEEGDRVSYETPAGRLSIRKDLVERVERGVSTSVPFGMPAEAPVQFTSSESLRLGEGYDEVARGVTGGGNLNRDYIARLETQARLGGQEPVNSKDAVRRVLMAYHAASNFLQARKEIDEAIRYSQRAFDYAPDQLDFLEQVAHLYLVKGEYRQALDYLERAKRQAPDDPNVAKLTGWAYSGQNKLKQAIEEWRRAYKLRPDPDVKEALEKAERDQQIESDYREGETWHFSLRYNGGAAPELAKDVLRALEEDFREIERTLRYTPSEPIGVILYTQEAFTDVTGAPAWAGAINDGRIRIPAQGLTRVSPALARKLKHELGHSFITLKTRGNAPVWLHEGIAQWLEGSRSDRQAATLVSAYDKGVHLPLADLEGSFLDKSNTLAGYAYAWSLAVVEYIVQENGPEYIERILDRIGGGSSTQDAIRDVVRMGYPRLEEETVNYLRKTYLK